MNKTAVEVFTPSRLTLGRQRRGLTQKGLGERTNLTDRAVRAYEAGRDTPSEHSLRSLADALSFPTAFFQAPPLEPLTLGAASFRALSKASGALRHRAISAGTLALELYRYQRERFDLPSPDLPDLRSMRPEHAAAAVRHRWALGQQPIPNVVHLLELHGVAVYSLSEDCDAIDAFSLWRDGVPFVFLNTRKTAERSIFDAAHELAHLVLHRHGEPQGREGEREADSFASNFLMPESAMLACAPLMPTIASLAALKSEWHVSVAALAHRLHELERISPWQYRHINVELSRRGRANEPAPLDRETSAIARKTLDALAEEGTTIRDIARELHLPPGEIRALTFGLHAVEPEGGCSGPGQPEGRWKKRPAMRLVTT